MVYISIVIIIFLFYLLCLYINYLNTKITNNIIQYKDYIINKIDTHYLEDFTIVFASMENVVIDRFLDSIQNLSPTFVFTNNFENNDIITYGGYNSIKEFPNDNINIKNKWIYGGYYIACNGFDYICVNANNENIKRYDNDIKYLSRSGNTFHDGIIITKILYKSEEIMLVNIDQISDSINNNTYFKYLGIILTIIKNTYLNNNKFIICGDVGLNSKYIKYAIDLVFGDSVISSCYDGIINYIGSNYVQPYFIILDKRLCNYGVRFSIRYLKNEISNTSFIIHAIVYNKYYYNNNNIEYFTDNISTNILNSIRNISDFNDQYVNWDKIDISTLDTNFEYNDDFLKNITSKFTKKLLIDVINNSA